MTLKKSLRILSLVMLIVAIIFLMFALNHPEFGTAFYIGDVYFGASQWLICYGIYFAVMLALFITSFFVKKKK